MDTRQIADEIASYSRGRVPRELRRRQVLAVTHDLFVERGYAGASMDELARRVGVSKPVVYDIARSKEALFRDVMAIVDEELAHAVVSAVAQEPDDARRLHAGIVAFLEFVRDRREAWAALVATDAGPASAELAALRRRQAMLVAHMVADQVDGADTRTAEALAQAISGAVEFVALWWTHHPDITAASLADLLTAAFSPGLRELVTRPLS